MSTEPAPDRRSPRTVRSRRGRRLRRNLLIGVPAAACLAVVGLLATSLGSPGQHVGQANPGWPGEGAGTARGEAMHGLQFVGKTVRTVLAMLARRGITVPQWRVQRSDGCVTVSRRTVPGNWYVYQAVPWAPGQVLLWATSAWPLPGCTYSAGQPSPSPSAG